MENVSQSSLNTITSESENEDDWFEIYNCGDNTRSEILISKDRINLDEDTQQHSNSSSSGINEKESTANGSLRRNRTFNNEKSSKLSVGDSKKVSNAVVKQSNVNDDCILNNESVKRSWNVMSTYVSNMKKKIKIMQQRNRRLRRSALLYRNILMYYKQKYLLPEHLALNLSNCELELDRTEYLN